MKIEEIDGEFSVCKVEDYSGVDLDGEFVFTGRTDEENSLVCPSENVPGNAASVAGGWRAFRVSGELDFSIVGLLAKISGALRKEMISMFAISTYNTDYILVKKEDFGRAVRAAEKAVECE